MRAMRWIAEVFTRDAHSGVVYCSAPVVSSTSSNGGFSPKPLGLGLFFCLAMPVIQLRHDVPQGECL